MKKYHKITNPAKRVLAGAYPNLATAIVGEARLLGFTQKEAGGYLEFHLRSALAALLAEKRGRNEREKRKAP
jgi:hypothetical protein